MAAEEERAMTEHGPPFGGWRRPSRPCCGLTTRGHEGPWPSIGFSHGGTRSVASVFGLGVSV